MDVEDMAGVVAAGTHSRIMQLFSLKFMQENSVKCRNNIAVAVKIHQVHARNFSQVQAQVYSSKQHLIWNLVAYLCYSKEQNLLLPLLK